MKRLGMLVPSSNIVLEPETAKILAPHHWLTCHVSRLPVVTISAEDGSRGQFDLPPVLATAKLLADARVDLILWNGTAASWLGFDRDRTLTEAIQAQTGIPATTAVLAINERLSRLGARRIGLVTPYIDAIDADIARNYREIGVDVVASERLRITDNFAIGEVSADQVSDMIRTVARARPEAIVVMCTNLVGAAFAETLSAELGIPVLDSVRVAVEHCVELLRPA
jgi:maleate isomerase